jgi:hypothetical protein
MMSPHALGATGQQYTVYTQLEVEMSRGDKGVSEVKQEEDIIGDEKVDEFDEEEPGVLPLMTSDLEYPEPEEVEAGGGKPYYCDFFYRF